MIAVLRIGHRIDRDKRITTHVALVARAFGADSIFITTKDDALEKNLRSICLRFGGDFKIVTGIHPKNIIKEWKGTIVHLTMYGDDLESSIVKIKKDTNLLIIVGAEKVPPFYYEISDFNISVGNQPHSEVAALALFLDRYTKGSWIYKTFNGQITILPSNKGKKVISKDG